MSGEVFRVNRPMEEGRKEEFQEWVDHALPGKVGVIALEFPIGTTFVINDETWHVVSYGVGHVSMSQIDPFQDWQKAAANLTKYSLDQLRGPNVIVIDPTTIVKDAN